MKSAILSAPAPDLIRLNDASWTTRENLQDEMLFLESLERLERNAKPIPFDPEFVEKQKRNFIHDKAQKTDFQELNEQSQTVFDEMTVQTPVMILTGPPGAAKSTVATLWTKLVRNIEPDIPVIAMTQEKPALNRISDKLGLKDAVTMLFDDALSKPKWKQNAVILIDEAGLIGTKTMARLLKCAADAHARRVILIGDDKQLLPDEAGQPFRWLRQSKKCPVVELSSPFRQKTRALQDLVNALYVGDVTTALDGMKITFADDLPKDLQKSLEGQSPDKSLVIVHGEDALLQKLKSASSAHRFYSLAAAQGLAVDHVVLVVGAPMTLSELLVGVSRQRYGLDILVDPNIYANKKQMRESFANYPISEMALDVIGEDGLKSL
jgi:hypothetical protein